MKILDGKKLSKDILAEVKKEVADLPFQPIFTDVLVGNDPSSVQYVRMKAKAAESVGIKFYNANFSETIKTHELITELENLNKIKNMCGIIIQLPLPAQIDRQAALDAIEPRLDVDCLGKVASEKFYQGEPLVSYPAALACMALLDSLRLDLKSKKIAILGQGMLVGRPVTALLQFRGLNPEVVRSKTENKEEIIKEADVII